MLANIHVNNMKHGFPLDLRMPCLCYALTEGMLHQEALAEAGAAYPTSAETGTGTYLGCMYTEYLDTVLAPQV